ncbi:hypothetical protein ACFOY8_19275 [Thalassospira xianhensis]|uniref:Uncharacterized protein n=1 Tax=Thalassospira xianhensis MCCC 1A02616 TaxID=1177929 RepID=A0A367U8T2_9PROT|nr:PspC domain-containing protein [Thalassospira xianhensis]RCK04725.1 hypothetical protein TH5_18360 [Thalassospira xianhensis MCCC 1A02616]
MTAQQAAAGAGYQRGHKKHRHGGCRFRHHDQDGRECGGVIRRTTRGIAEKFGIPRKGVLIAFILILIFSFPVGVMLFALAWAYVHHPEWFDGLRGKFRGAGRPGSYNASATLAGAAEERPTMGVDFEEPWMDELREKFDDLERRTGSMEGYVASGDYRLASELEKMKKDDTSDKNDVGGKADNASSSPNDKA